MTEALVPYGSEATTLNSAAPELIVLESGMTELALEVSRALAAGSDWVVDYRGCKPGEGPRRYLKPEVMGRYALSLKLKVVE